MKALVFGSRVLGIHSFDSDLDIISPQNEIYQGQDSSVLHDVQTDLFLAKVTGPLQYTSVCPARLNLVAEQIRNLDQWTSPVKENDFKFESLTPVYFFWREKGVCFRAYKYKFVTTRALHIALPSGRCSLDFVIPSSSREVQYLASGTKITMVHTLCGHFLDTVRKYDRARKITELMSYDDWHNWRNNQDKLHRYRSVGISCAPTMRSGNLRFIDDTVGFITYNKTTFGL